MSGGIQIEDIRELVGALTQARVHLRAAISILEHERGSPMRTVSIDHVLKYDIGMLKNADVDVKRIRDSYTK